MTTKTIKLALTALTAGAILASQPARADDFAKGMRGPTDHQADLRLGYTENDQGVQAYTETLLLKYWDGKEIGKFGLLALPYKQIDGPKSDSEGVGDLTLSLGPRASFGKRLHFMSYAGLSLPTGDDKAKPALGTGRIDLKLGLTGTYQFPDKKTELDLAIERTFTGENRLGVNPSAETYFGVFAGRTLTDRLKFGLGFTEFRRDNGDYNRSLRAIARYTFSPSWHIELVGDKTIDRENMPEAQSVGVFVRRNF